MTEYLKVVPIVEGHGDVAAVPVLLRRCAEHFYSTVTVDVLTPVGQPRDRLVKNKDECLVRSVQLAQAKLIQHQVPESMSWILVIVDADDDCAATLGPAMLKAVASAGVTIPVSVTLAVREFETWLVGGANTLTDQLRETDPPDAPEASGARKGWIEKRIRTPKYSETVDQPRLAAAFDLGRCRKTCPSFDKLCREFGAQVGMV